MLVLFALTLFKGDAYASMIVQSDPSDVTAKIYGFEMVIGSAGGTMSKEAVRIFALGSVFMFGLMAMVFRNIQLILKTSRGETWFSKGETPFQEDVTRMVREIGIFYIASIVVGLIFSVIARLTVGVEAAEISVDLSNVFVGILIICLSQVFSEGTQLRQDVDGLV